jgi:hypothetical protein
MAVSKSAKAPQKRPAEGQIQSAPKRQEPAKKPVRRATDLLDDSSDDDYSEESDNSVQAAKPSWLPSKPVAPTFRGDGLRLTPPPLAPPPLAPPPLAPPTNVDVKFDEKPGVKSAATCGLNVTITFPSNLQAGAAAALRAMVDRMIGAA